MKESTYILVHGAWGGVWCWDEFTKVLDGRNVRWRAVSLPSSQIGSDPSSDLAADAHVITAAASEVDGRVVLVGHSYAGAVITEAASHVPNLEGLFYIAATVPEVGQSHSDTARLVRVRTLMDSAIRVEGDLLVLDRKIAPLALYQECSPELRTWAASRLSTQTLASFRSACTSPSANVASRYVLCRHDHALDPSLQELVSGRCDEVIEMESDHCPFLSHPALLADVLLG